MTRKITYLNQHELFAECHHRFKIEEGTLTSKISIQGLKVDAVVGNPINHGYLQSHIKGKNYLVHRLIFLMENGYLPNQVDHVDGDPSNNKIENLRSCTQSENMQNSKLRKDNTSGFKGVSWDESRKKWMAQITTRGKCKKLGRFDDKEVAAQVLRIERAKNHGIFANHGESA